MINFFCLSSQLRRYVWVFMICSCFFDFFSVFWVSNAFLAVWHTLTPPKLRIGLKLLKTCNEYRSEELTIRLGFLCINTFRFMKFYCGSYGSFVVVCLNLSTFWVSKDFVAVWNTLTTYPVGIGLKTSEHSHWVQ